MPNSAIAWHAERAIYFTLGTTYSTNCEFILFVGFASILWFSQISTSNMSCSIGFFTQLPSWARTNASFNWRLASYHKRKQNKTIIFFSLHLYIHICIHMYVCIWICKNILHAYGCLCNEHYLIVTYRVILDRRFSIEIMTALILIGIVDRFQFT